MKPPAGNAGGFVVSVVPLGPPLRFLSSRKKSAKSDLTYYVKYQNLLYLSP